MNLTDRYIIKQGPYYYDGSASGTYLQCRATRLFKHELKMVKRAWYGFITEAYPGCNEECYPMRIIRLTKKQQKTPLKVAEEVVAAAEADTQRNPSDDGTQTS